MDYKDKNIKYKTKYQELKNIDTNINKDMISKIITGTRGHNNLSVSYFFYYNNISSLMQLVIFLN